MKMIPGVKIELWFQGGKNIAPRQMAVADDGYVGKLGGGARFAIQAIVEKDAPVYGVNVDGKKNVILKMDVAPERPFTGTSGCRRLYEQKCEVRSSQDSTACTWTNDNHLNLLEAPSGGRIRYWEIALVSRGGQFFLTSQCLYEAQCYRDKNGRVVCPFFQGEQFPDEEREWPQMVDLIVAFMADTVLPSVNKYRPTSKPSTNDLGSNKGKVLWWNHMSGVGCILTLEGEAKVYWRQITRPPGSRLVHLVPGEIVAHGELVAANRDGVKKTGFRYEALDVFPIKPAQ